MNITKDCNMYEYTLFVKGKIFHRYIQDVKLKGAEIIQFTSQDGIGTRNVGYYFAERLLHVHELLGKYAAQDFNFKLDSVTQIINTRVEKSH